MEYIVEKLIDDEWYLEGEGPIEYVNRVIPYLVNNGMVFRIKEVSRKGD